MQSGRALLKQWIERRGYNQVEAAGELGFTEAFMSLLVNGHRSPGLVNAVKIERVTGIPVEAWMDSARDKTA